MIWFTSDEHYGHANIIKYCKRPFATLDAMEEILIDRHNQKVNAGDTVYHLGDMFWRTLGAMKAHEIMNQLNGQHYYIRGNHEELMNSSLSLRNRFQGCEDLATVHYSKALRSCGIQSVPPIVLCHYAMRVWPGSHKGSWHLYGHSHGELPEQGLSFDVGVDAQNFYPVSLQEVAAKMQEKIKVQNERIQYMKELEWLNRKAQNT